MTDLIEVKTADLTGEALGWAVGRAEGLDLELEPPHYGASWRVFARHRYTATEEAKRFNPWEDWALGGPLLHKHNVSLHCPQKDWDYWEAWITENGKAVAQSADSPLLAACRAIVSRKLGDTVKLPKALIKPFAI